MTALDTCRGQANDVSLSNYFQALLTGIDAPLTDANFIVLTAWSACEGPAASQGGYNPLNTTLKTKNVLPGNAGFLGNNPQQNGGDPVKNYNGWDAGIQATISSMGSGIKNALKGGSNPSSVVSALVAQRWGTGGGCILSKIAQYEASPSVLCKDIQQPVNTNKTNQGGAGATADAGAAQPINIPGESLLSGLASPLTTLLGDVTSGKFWLRVGQIFLGVLLLVIGLFFILSETSAGKDAEKAASVAALA